MDIWNTKNLNPPPALCCSAPVRETDVRVLENILKSSIDFFTSQKQLHTEAAILQRVIYRMKLKFRSSKDFKFVQKLNRALLAYLHMDIPGVLKRFLEMIPECYNLKDIHMPSRNMLDFVLIRLQGLGKIFERILYTCRLSATYQQKSLKLGHFWKVVIIVYALISRIFVIAKNILRYICDLYSNLQPFTFKLRNSGVQWLPHEHVLPQSLADWLKFDELELDTSIIEIPDDETLESYFNLLSETEDDELEINDEYILIRDEDENNASNNVEEIIDLVSPVKMLRNTKNLNANDSVICLNTSYSADVGQVVAGTSTLPGRLDRKRKQNDSVIFVGPWSEKKKGQSNTTPDLNVNNGSATNLQSPKIGKRRRKKLRKLAGEPPNKKRKPEDVKNNFQMEKSEPQNKNSGLNDFIPLSCSLRKTTHQTKNAMTPTSKKGGKGNTQNITAKMNPQKNKYNKAKNKAGNSNPMGVSQNLQFGVNQKASKKRKRGRNR